MGQEFFYEQPYVVFVRHEGFEEPVVRVFGAQFIHNRKFLLVKALCFGRFLLNGFMETQEHLPPRYNRLQRYGQW